MSTITVKNSTELNLALKAAKAGDSIFLQSGTYSGVNALSLRPGGDITIGSVDPGNPAVITGLKVTDSVGLNFQNLEFSVTGQTVHNPITVSRSEDIHFTNIEVHGSVDGKFDGDVYPLLLRDSKNISITNSDFHDVLSGLTHLNVEGLVLTGNNFFDIREDGIRGGGSSNVTISKNTFTDFFSQAGDHSDAIQFWTTNVTTSARNIVITDNVVERGDGEPIQGIFLSNDDHLPYINVTITGNMLVGTMYNGIYVDSGQNINISDNDLLSLKDMQTWIRLGNITGGALEDNSASTYLLGTMKNVTQSDNAKNVAVTPAAGDEAIRAWLGQVTMPNLSDYFASLIGGVKPPVVVPPVIVAPPVVVPPVVVPPVVVPPVVVKPPVVTPPVTAPPAPTNPSHAADVDASGPSAPGMSGVSITSSTTAVMTTTQHNLTLTGSGEISAVGSGLNNVMIGNSAANKILAMGGNDYVNAGAGNDSVRGDAGNDIVLGGLGNDTVNGNAGDDALYGGSGDDQLYGDDGNDALYGGIGNDLLNGNAGNDKLWAGAGNDQALGGAGNDTILGESGNDFLSGDQGADVLTGGAGADTFNMARGFGIDRVTDFSFAEGDKIKLTGTTTYTVSQVGQDTVINLGGSDQMVLVGVDQASLKAGWLLAG